MRLQDKVVLVTAANRGIGLAIVEACAREGAVVYMAARNLERARQAAAGLQEQGYRVRCVYHDATLPQTYAPLMEQVIRGDGRIDVLVNNFGISDPRKDLDLARTEPDAFCETVQANLRSVYMASREAIRYMAEQGGGSIVNISSVGGLVPDISQIGYGTSKAAINYLTRLIAVQEAHHHIRCNAVLPGMTGTDAVAEKLSEDFRALFMRHIPFGRMARPEEIAEAVLYFASDAAAYTTGQILTVAGGFGLPTPVYADLAAGGASRG